MPHSRDRDRSASHRKFNRSISPQGNDRKRSWLPSSNNRGHFNRSPSPKRQDLKPGPKPRQPALCRSRSRSPRHQKRNFTNNEGYSRFSQKNNHKQRSPVRHDKPVNAHRQDFRSRKRSPFPNPSKNQFGNFRDNRPKTSLPSNNSRYQNNSSKKKSQGSPSPVQKKSRRDRSSSPAPPLSKKLEGSRKGHLREGSIPQQKVSSSIKNKIERMTLHSRFSIDECEPFHLLSKDNVTIAILRNPKAVPVDDVTVKKIFDSSLFKMVRKKNEGRKPIFDREEIKQWRHDEKLDEDPDFEERRLIRVKSAPKKSADNLLQMSPDVLRKSLAFGKRSSSQSPHRSPNVRLNPQPDSRYESRYQKHLKKGDYESNQRHREGEKRGRGDGDNSSRDRRDANNSSRDRRDANNSSRDRRDVDNSRDQRDTKGDDYDLRNALDRRRSGREENFDRPERRNTELRKFSDHDDRNVVMDQDRGRFRDGGDRARGQGMDRGRDWGRGRGRGMRQHWSPERDDQDRGFDKRDRFSRSPEYFRGRGRGGFRGRGRGRDNMFFDNNSPPADNFHKYVNHDDRDLSPLLSIPLGGGNSYTNSTRGFKGGNQFHFGNRGQGFRGRGRGRNFNNNRDTRSIQRMDRGSFDRTTDREWKHDMYDSVQSDDEVPHNN